MRSTVVLALILPLVSVGVMPAFALTQNECVDLANLSQTELGYTVVTCDNPFNVSVNIGQRLHIQNPNGGSANILPSASYGGVGTYQYSSDGTSGTVSLQNPPDIGITFDNVQTSFSGSQMSVSGNIINSNSFAVKDLYVYWHVTDSSGNYFSSWQKYGNDGQAYSTQISPQSSMSFSETLCCLPSPGASQVTPYVVQAFREDGTKLITTNNLPSLPSDGQFVLPCSMQEKGDGVSASSCHGFYQDGVARAEVGINYHSGLFPIKDYHAAGYFVDQNGVQGQNISVNLNQISPGESKTLVFTNTASGFVSEFKMQMLGGTLQTSDTQTSSAPTISITSLKPGYVLGDSAGFNGKVTGHNDPSVLVTVRAIGPLVNGKSDNIVMVQQVDLQPDGTFMGGFGTSGPLWTKSGQYKIVANYGASSAETEFFFTYNEPTVTQGTHYITTNKKSYNYGETVLISGKVNQILPNTPIIIQTFFGNNLVDVMQVELDSDGIFWYALPTDTVYFKNSGTYTVKGTYGVSSNVYETTFDFAAEGSTDTQPVTFTVKTTKSVYEGGETVKVHGTFSTHLGNNPNPVVITILRNSIALHYAEAQIQNNSFSFEFAAEGNSFANDGTYVIRAGYGTTVHETSFELVSNDVPDADDDLPSTLQVSIPLGSSSPGCEATDQCYAPHVGKIVQGGEIIWVNHDTAAHTVTSGDVKAGGPDGNFDSGLFMSGATFSHTFEQAGQFPYFCLVHPWMEGIVLVGEGNYVPHSPEPTPVSINISADRSSYDIGNSVRISITTQGIQDAHDVGITITNPSGSVVISRSVPIQGGFASLEFKIPEDFGSGNYRIDATASVNGQIYKQSTYFKIVSQFNQVRIVSVDSTDQQGNPSPLKRGEMGFVKVTVSSDKAITGLVTVNLFDSELTTIGIGSLKSTFSSGNSEMILSFMIPNDTAGDTADVYVNVFSDWVSNGGIPLTKEVAKQVRIN